MTFNWLDILFAVILLIAVIFGFIRGLVRQVIGITAVIMGLFLAITYYRGLGQVYMDIFREQTLSYFLGFITIFLLVWMLGWAIGLAFTKMMKGPLNFINKLLGISVGLLKGALVCGILVVAMLVFPVNKSALKTSSLAPFCLYVTEVVVWLIPMDLKLKLADTYKEVFPERWQRWKSNIRT